MGRLRGPGSRSGIERRPAPISESPPPSPASDEPPLAGRTISRSRVPPSWSGVALMASNGRPGRHPAPRPAIPSRLTSHRTAAPAGTNRDDPAIGRTICEYGGRSDDGPGRRHVRHLPLAAAALRAVLGLRPSRRPGPSGSGRMTSAPCTRRASFSRAEARSHALDPIAGARPGPIGSRAGLSTRCERRPLRPPLAAPSGRSNQRT